MQSLHSVPVNLPQGEAAAIKPQEPVTLTITGDAQIYLNSTPTALDCVIR